MSNLLPQTLVVKVRVRVTILARVTVRVRIMVSWFGIVLGL